MKSNHRPLDTDGVHQQRYDLPHLVYTAKVYPLRSQQQKLQIVVTGHGKGIRLLWREGARRNDTDKAGKQHESRRVRDQVGHSAAIAVKDIPLGGSQALHIALPPLSTSADHDNYSLPSLFSKKLVIAVACSDLNIRLVTAPLEPPGSSAEAPYTFEVLELANPQGSSNLPNSVAVTFTIRPESEEQDEDTTMLVSQASRGSAESQGNTSKSLVQRETRSAEPEAPNWDLVIASHFPTLSGILYIHRLPLARGGLDFPTESGPPSQKLFLSSPAISLRFSSASYPSPRHSRLLIAQQGGIIRAFDSSLSDTGDRSPWISTFFTPFETFNPRSLPRRVPVLDASWILGAKAIIVLLSDGKWGVWDIDGAGPKHPNSSVESGRSTSHSGFVLSGSVGAFDKLGISNSSKNEVMSKQKLAPMTPATRKIKSEKLFAGPVPEGRDTFLQGGTSVIPASAAVRSRTDDETVLFWYGFTIAIIPSFVAHWQSKVKGSGPLLANGSRGAVKTIRGVHLGGERCQEVVLCPPSNSGSAESEMLVTAERSLVVATQEGKKPQQANKAPQQEEDGSDIFMDEDQLAAGDLSIQGMNRILDGMSSQQDLLLPEVANGESLL